MTNRNHEFSDADIHAYVDGQLEPARANQLTAQLKVDAQLARQIQEYQQINANLHALLDPIQQEKIPEALVQTAITPPEKNRKPWISLAQAAVLAVLMVSSGLAGWIIRGDNDQAIFALIHTDLVQPATFAHAIYASDSIRPVEITSENEAQLINWLSNRLKTTIKAPSLASQGFHLLGGRLIPSTNRMAAQFMYQNEAGIRVSLYVRRGDWDKENMPLQYDEGNGMAAFTWINNSMGYALSSGNLQKIELLALAETAHQ